MRFIAAGTIGLAIVTALPGAASAKTLQVDDDRAQCRSAPYTAIQPAVNAAAAGDVISVCAGSYPGQVVLPRGKNNLQLRAVANLKARLRMPAGGIPHDHQTDGDTDPAAVVVVRSRNALVRGFFIEGPEGYADPAEACQANTHLSAIAVPEGTATIDSNRISAGASFCPGGPDRFGAGVHAGDIEGTFTLGAPVRVAPVVKVDRNAFSFGTAVFAEQTAGMTVQRNTMQGFSTGIGTATRVGIGVALVKDCCGNPPPPQFDARVQDNDMTGLAAGVYVSQGGRPLIVGNRMRDNEDGVNIFESSAGEVRGNSITGGGTGIDLGDPFFNDGGVGYLVRNNRVRNNSGDGIRVRSPSARNQLLDNTSLGNGGLDCRDESTGTRTAGTANTWTRNIGVTDSPNVCRAP